MRLDDIALGVTSRCRLNQILGIVAIVTLVLAGRVAASPYFEINTAAGWTSALADGSIVPITNFSDFTDLPYDSSLYATPALSVSGDSLELDFGGNEAVGGFAYNFPEDPNLNGSTLSLDVQSKKGAGYTIALIDSHFNEKNFYFTGTGGEISFNVSAGAGDGSLSGIVDNSGNPVTASVFGDSQFDLSNVSANGLGIVMYYPANSGDSFVGSVDVLPEPAAVIGVVGGAIAMAAVRPRRRGAAAA